MMEWITLGRTALKLEAQWRSWPAAAAYVEQLLHERVHERKGFAEPSRAVVDTVAVTIATRQPQTGAQRTAGPAAASGTSCHKWNSVDGCTRGAGTCTFAHVCNRCGLASHGGHMCPANPRHVPAGGGSRGPGIQRGGRGGGRGRGGSGSTVTTHADTPAPQQT